MNLLKNPDWVKDFNYDYTTFDSIPKSVFDTINKDLDLITGPNPLVTIVVLAWNEEINILRCIASLSQTKFDSPIEIIVVNNNSTDRTQDTIDQLHVRSVFESTQGWGPARQTGMENGNGKYILLADSDCFYPSCWVHKMISTLSKPNVVCVYGRYSFLSEPDIPRWKLYLFERMKDLISEFRQINRPYFNCYGLSMGFIRELGLKIGFIQTNFRGDDGQMCLRLMDYGKIKPVRSNEARAWTGGRTLARDGNLFNAFYVRLKKESKRFFNNFNSNLPENSIHKSKGLDN